MNMDHKLTHAMIALHTTVIIVRMMACIISVLCAKSAKGATALIVVGRGAALVVIFGGVWHAVISNDVIDVKRIIVPHVFRKQSATVVVPTTSGARAVLLLMMFLEAAMVAV